MVSPSRTRAATTQPHSAWRMRRSRRGPLVIAALGATIPPTITSFPSANWMTSLAPPIPTMPTSSSAVVADGSMTTSTPSRSAPSRISGSSIRAMVVLVPSSVAVKQARTLAPSEFDTAISRSDFSAPASSRRCLLAPLPVSTRASIDSWSCAARLSSYSMTTTS